MEYKKTFFFLCNEKIFINDKNSNDTQLTKQSLALEKKKIAHFIMNVVLYQLGHKV